jgi:hypothetical protein
LTGKESLIPYFKIEASRRKPPLVTMLIPILAIAITIRMAY